MTVGWKTTALLPVAMERMVPVLMNRSVSVPEVVPTTSAVEASVQRPSLRTADPGGEGDVAGLADLTGRRR